MSIYSLGMRTTNVTINQAAVEIITAPTLAIKIMEIKMTLASGSTSVFGLGRPQAQGITPVPVYFMPEQNSSDPQSKTVASLSWATSPTVPGSFLDRVTLYGTLGAGMIWSFPRGLHVPASTSLVLWNITANGTLDLCIKIDE